MNLLAYSMLQNNYISVEKKVELFQGQSNSLTEIFSNLWDFTNRYLKINKCLFFSFLFFAIIWIAKFVSKIFGWL